MKYLSLLGALIISLSTFAQINSQHQAFVEVGGLVSSAERTPFWLRANQFGTVPASAPIGTARVGINGSVLLTDTSGLYARKAPSRAYILNYSAETVGNIGKENQLLMPEYYVQLAHRQLELMVGRRREVIGLVDTTLSSGSYSWSGNALPIPKIRFGTKGFAPLGRRQWLAINAFIAHGQFDTDYILHSFLHQKSVFFRVGKPSSVVRFYIGLNHNVQWGGQSNDLPPGLAVNGKLPGEFRDFPNVLFAIRIGGKLDPRLTQFDWVNLFGNHVGSTDFGFELKLPSVNLMLYHQHSFEDASGVMMQNLPDGLTGLRIRPVNNRTSSFAIDGLLIEYLSTLNQSGPTFNQTNTTVKGGDHYFNNEQYSKGWVYHDHIIGTPFITRKQAVREVYGNTTNWAINNNRVQMAHIGLQATVLQRMKLMAKFSYSRNHGVPGEPLPGTPAQFSSLVQLALPVNWLGGSFLNASMSADVGQLYDNAIGSYIGLRKTVWQKGK